MTWQRVAPQPCASTPGGSREASPFSEATLNTSVWPSTEEALGTTRDQGPARGNKHTQEAADVHQGPGKKDEDEGARGLARCALAALRVGTCCLTERVDASLLSTKGRWANAVELM